MRKFAVCKKYNEDEVTLPQRSTTYSAGYDFFAVEDIEIPSIWKKSGEALEYRERALNSKRPFAKVLEKISLMLKPTKVKTGVKVYMNNDEYLQIVNRSSNPLDRFLLLANGVGIVDADYADNIKNDGEIAFLFWNFGVFNLKIKKGEKIGQGIFHKFLLTDDDQPDNVTRTGGFGSTNN